MDNAKMREAFKVDWPNLKMPSDVMGGEQADRHAFAIYKAGYLASLTQQPESEPLSFYDKMQEAFDAWEKENECKCVFEDFKAGYLAALTKQPESEPVFEIQHGPINDNDGHPKWASIESLGGWDEFNFAPGTKLYAGPPPVQQPESEPIGYAQAAPQVPDFGPLLPPSGMAKKVFEKTLENNPDADMHAVPKEWLLRERARSSELNYALEEAVAQVPEGWRIERTGRYGRILVYPYAREEMPLEIPRDPDPGAVENGFAHDYLYMLCEDLLAAQPSPQVPEGWRAQVRRVRNYSDPDDVFEAVPVRVLETEDFAPSVAEQQEWVTMADREPEDDSIVWTRWEGMLDTQGRAPATGAVAKSLAPYTRDLQWLDTGLRRPESPQETK